MPKTTPQNPKQKIDPQLLHPAVLGGLIDEIKEETDRLYALFSVIERTLAPEDEDEDGDSLHLEAWALAKIGCDLAAEQANIYMLKRNIAALEVVA